MSTVETGVSVFSIVWFSLFCSFVCSLSCFLLSDCLCLLSSFLLSDYLFARCLLSSCLIVCACCLVSFCRIICLVVVLFSLVSIVCCLSCFLLSDRFFCLLVLFVSVLALLIVCLLERTCVPVSESSRFPPQLHAVPHHLGRLRLPPDRECEPGAGSDVLHHLCFLRLLRAAQHVPRHHQRHVRRGQVRHR